MSRRRRNRRRERERGRGVALRRRAMLEAGGFGVVVGVLFGIASGDVAVALASAAVLGALFAAGAAAFGPRH